MLGEKPRVTQYQKYCLEQKDIYSYVSTKKHVIKSTDSTLCR
jgi:hypothetical protein